MEQVLHQNTSRSIPVNRLQQWTSQWSTSSIMAQCLHQITRLTIPGIAAWK
jgi:hypothetical protein